MFTWKFILCLLSLMLISRVPIAKASLTTGELMSTSSAFMWVQISDTHIMEKGKNVQREAWLKEAIREINKLKPDFVVVTGDLVESAAEKAYQNYVSIMSELDVPLYNVIGNHDDNSAANPSDYANLYKKYISPQTYYSFDWKGYHFVILDSVKPTIHSGTFHVPEDQITWLKKDLVEAGNKNIVMFSHHPPAGGRTDVDDHDDLKAIIRNHNVKAFYSAHRHGKPLEEYIGGVYYVNTGAVSSFPLGGSKLGYRLNIMDGDQLYTSWITNTEWKRLHPRENYVWWEGESPIETNFPKETYFSASTFEHNRHLLSGGDWLTNAGERGKDEAFAKYKIEVPDDGEYNLWSRKFWKHGPFRWRFDGDEWRVCGRSVSLADSTYIRTHLGANWVYLGKVNLKRGSRIFELKLLAEEGESQTACFDAFLLTPGLFMPNGKLKPGEKSGLADPGYFAFEPSIDPFTSKSMLDLRYLNEKAAGESGFIKHDGTNFTMGNGEPVRFWGVNVNANNSGQSRGSIDYLSRKLAKLGVNIVRHHSAIYDDREDPANVNPQKLDNIFYTVSSMKKEGIYTFLSFYFPLWFHVKPHYNIPGYDTIDNKVPFALLTFDQRMQEIYKSWARKLLDTKNPYTGLTLGHDPAVAIVEIINEDSYFFWTFTKRNIPEIHWHRLETLYGEWLIEHYGSLEEAFSAWSDAKLDTDNAASGRAGLYEAWHMTTEGSKSGGTDKAKRVGDQVRFLAEHQREFYTSIVNYFKKELGVGGLISPSNWHVSDGPMLDALERYTYTAGDVIDRHGYFGGEHKGEGANYSVREGHTFKNRAAVKAPGNLPIQFFQIDDYPHIISEIGWPNPNRYRSDATFLSSAYGSLQGADGFFFFAVGSNFVNDMNISKFQLCTPVTAGTFPATALQYRRGDIQEAENAVYQILALEDLYKMKGSGTSTAEALDELRKMDIPKNGKVTGAVNSLDPLSFYVGRVMRTFGKNPNDSTQRNLKKYIDRESKTIASITDELFWNYGTGIAIVDTPRSQGAAGFLSEVTNIELTDIIIESGNEFSSIMVISMDDHPLKTSRKILIQTMTAEQPYGFKTENGAITDLGGAPFGVEKIDAKISLKSSSKGVPKIIALDENGYPTEKAVAISNESPLGIQLSEDSIYHIVQWNEE